MSIPHPLWHFDTQPAQSFGPAIENRIVTERRSASYPVGSMLSKTVGLMGVEIRLNRPSPPDLCQIAQDDRLMTRAWACQETHGKLGQTASVAEVRFLGVGALMACYVWDNSTDQTRATHFNQGGWR